MFLQQLRRHLWVKQCHYRTAEAQPGTLVTSVFGKAVGADFEVGTGAAG